MYVYYNLFSIIEDNKIMIGAADFAKEIPDTIQLLIREDYERIVGETVPLSSDEVLLFDSKNTFGFSTVIIGNTTYQVKSKIDNPLKMDKSQSPNMIMIVDLETLESIMETDFRLERLTFRLLQMQLFLGTQIKRQEKKQYI